MIRLLIAKTGGVIFGCLIALIIFLWQSNNILREKNKSLILQQKNQLLHIKSSSQGQTIETQKKVIDVVKNTKPVDFDTNIERMQNGEL